MNRIHPSLPDSHATLEVRIARRITARLSERAEQIDSDISERLRYARERALQVAKAARAPVQQPVGLSAGGAALLGARHARWWLRLSVALPLLALICGLVVIQKMQASSQVAVAVEVDAALLSDDLPPSAYSDAGFVEFLKTSPRL